MSYSRFLLQAGVLSFLISLVSAQQIVSSPVSNKYPGVSNACQTALNTTVSCPYFLQDVSVENPRLQADQLTSLCTSQCLASLNSARSAIQSACTASDTIEDGVDLYPATLIVDRYIYTHKLSCRTDSVSGQFCDTIFLSWLNTGARTAAQNCSDCVLGGMQTDLNSPFGFDLDYEQDFASRTSSCNKFTYSYTTPAPYKVSSSTTLPLSGSATVTAADPGPSCRANHVVDISDTCYSIALQHGVSSYSVVQLNGLFPGCSNLREADTLCIGVACTTYQVDPSDTCGSILQSLGGAVTATQFLAWNPNIDPLCGNLHDTAGMVVCIGPPGGSLYPVQATTILATSAAISPVPKPTNALAESTSNCGRWYTVQEGDTCQDVSIYFSITLTEFYFLNPSLDAGCTNLWLATSYCVASVGDVATYPGYPISSGPSLPYTLTSDAFTTESWTTVTPVISYYPVQTAQPLAPGTLTTCEVYHNGTEPSIFVDQSISENVRDMYHESYSWCNTTAYLYGETLDNLLLWNPSLVPGNATGNCTLLPGFRYCAQLEAEAPALPVSNPCLTLEPGDRKVGTANNCQCFTAVFGYDSSYYGCDHIAEEFNTTVNNIKSWNTWVGTDCDAGIFSGLSATDYVTYNAVCVFANGTANGTATASPSISSTSTTPPGPTQTGMVSGCTQLYTVQSGDSCSAIETEFGITFETFLAWNPSIGTNCESLLLGFAYCVAAPTISSSALPSTTSSAPPIGPTQEGIPAGCTTYYTTVSGDGCFDIAQRFGITLQQFYDWNPPLNGDCSGLFLGYSYCVAGGPP